MAHWGREGGGSTPRWGRKGGRENNSFRVQEGAGENKDFLFSFRDCESSVDCTGEASRLTWHTLMHAWPSHLAASWQQCVTTANLIIGTPMSIWSTWFLFLTKHTDFPLNCSFSLFKVTSFFVIILSVSQPKLFSMIKRKGLWYSDERETPGARVPHRWDRCAWLRRGVCGGTECGGGQVVVR